MADETDCSDYSSSSLKSESLSLHDDLSSKVGEPVYNLAASNLSMPSFVDHVIKNDIETKSFLVCNLATIAEQYRQWKRELPIVDPFYAVKCNPDPAIVRLLASMGCNFDCATMGEIDMVVNQIGQAQSFKNHPGKAATSIVYANPAKMDHMIQFAMTNGVRMTVFDGEDELYKIARLGGHEKLDLLLRLTTDDASSVCRFSGKFGCPVEESKDLLVLAQSLGLHVAGVSFHVGSGCGDAAAYTTALDHARQVFQFGAELGMPAMNVVDIGGGFPGDTGGYGGPGMPSFQDLAVAIREGIATFQKIITQPVRFLSEPGRYFVSRCTTIATKVYARKGGKNAYQALYCDNGVYGSFNTVVYDHAAPVCERLNTVLATQKKNLSSFSSCSSLMSLDSDSSPHPTDEPTSTNESVAQIPSAVFGPTCDGLDQMCSMENTKLPRCEIGDWLIFDNQGAYTHTASFVFNGYTHVPNKLHCSLQE